MAYDIGVRLGVDGEKAFRSSINAINANIKSMGSELKAVTAQFAKNADSEEALTAKNQVLAKSIAATKEKISVLDKQLERQAEKLRDLGQALDDVVKSHGAESKEALAAQNAYNNQAKAVAKLQDQLNGAKAELAGMENAVKDNKDAIDGLGREVEDAGEAMDEAGRNAHNFGEKLKSGLATAAKVTTAAAAAISAATAALVKSSIDDFSNYEQLVGGVETLFKSSAGQVQAYAQSAFKTAGLSANEYMDTVTSFSASLLQGLSGDTAEAAKLADLAITDMADNANKMGTEMESIQYAYQGFAKQNYTMLDNLKLGYGGTQEEMIRLINDSGILNEEIKNLDNVTFDQIIQAIHEVQTQIGITGTTALEAEETIQGSTAAMKSAWDNLKTGLASGDQDMGKLVSDFTSSVETAAQNLLPRVRVILENIGPMVGQILAASLAAFLPEAEVDAITEQVAGFLDVMKMLIPVMAGATSAMVAYKAASSISGVIDMLINATKGQTVAQAALNAVMNANPFVLVATLIAGLVTALVTLYMTNETFRNKVNAAWTSVTTTISSGAQKIKTFFTETIPNAGRKAVDWFTSIPDQMKKVGKDLITSLWNGINDKVEWLKSKVSGVIESIKGIFGGGSSSTASGGGGAGRRSAAAPAAMAVWEPEAEPNPAPFRAARFGSGLIPQTLTRSLSETEAGVRTTAAIRRVQRDMADAGASVAAYYTAPERRGGGNPSAGNAGNGVDAAAIGQAVREALEGAKVVVDGRTLGRVTMTQQSNMGRAFGTA